MTELSASASELSVSTLRTAEPLRLASDFPPASRDQWRELVAEVLRKTGRLPDDLAEPVEALLTTELCEGVPVAPLYTAEDAADRAGVPGQAPFIRGGRPLGTS